MYETLTLAALPVGESGYVTEISTRPTMEHRLMDLGLVRGTRVTCVTRSRRVTREPISSGAPSLPCAGRMRKEFSWSGRNWSIPLWARPCHE